MGNYSPFLHQETNGGSINHILIGFIGVESIPVYKSTLSQNYYCSDYENIGTFIKLTNGSKYIVDMDMEQLKSVLFGK